MIEFILTKYKTKIDGRISPVPIQTTYKMKRVYVFQRPLDDQ